MNDRNDREATTALTASRFQTIGAEELGRALFRGDLPLDFIRSLPAQSLYLATKSVGDEALLEVLPHLSREQYQVFLDLELWTKDSFAIDRLWEFAKILEQDDSLDALHGLLRTIDLKLLSHIVLTSVEVITVDERTDLPPQEGFYTPDRGFTWLAFRGEDADTQRILGKLLALLYESNSDLFYQLLAVRLAATPTQLEEEAYQDRIRRLSDEGIPESETSFAIHSPLKPDTLSQHLTNDALPQFVDLTTAVTPLVYSGSLLSPLAQAVQWVAAHRGREQFEEEVTVLMNSAIVRWGVPAYEWNEVKRLLDTVYGAINIGLEHAMALAPSREPGPILQHLGTTMLYRVGLHEILRIGRAARARESTQTTDNPFLLELISALTDEVLPLVPEALQDDGTLRLDAPGRLVSGRRPITTLALVTTCTKVLSAG